MVSTKTMVGIGLVSVILILIAAAAIQLTLTPEPQTPLVAPESLNEDIEDPANEEPLIQVYDDPMTGEYCYYDPSTGEYICEGCGEDVEEV